MPWAKLDDNFPEHPKIRRAWRCRPAVGLWAMSLARSMRYGTRGKVDTEWVEDQLPDAGERDAVVAVLEQCGLWEKNGDGWVVHDFHDWNPTPEQVEDRRAADRERKRKAGAR